MLRKNMDKETIMGDKRIILLPAVPYSQSCYEGFEAEKAVDGDPETCWKAGPYYQWLLLDLRSECRVSHMELRFSQTAYYYHYHIEYSSDRMNWHFLFEKENNSPEPPDGMICAVEKNCRFIRITVSYCSGSEDAEISNVSVYGC